MQQKISTLSGKDNTFILVMDAGGFSAGLGKSNQLKTEYLLRGFKMMNYCAINLGYRDFLYGTINTKNIQKKYQPPFVSSNIFDPVSKKPFTQRNKNKNLKNKNGGIKVGKIGLAPKNANLIPEHRRQGGGLLEARDPIANAKEIVADLKNKVDIIICLAYMRIQQVTKLAEKVPDIDVIILGNDYKNQQRVVNDGKTRIVSIVRQGKYIGDLSLQLDANKKIIDHKYIAVVLDDKYGDDPELAKLSASYKKEITKR